MGFLSKEVRLGGRTSKESMFLKPPFNCRFGDFFWNFIRISPLYFKFPLENYNVIIDRIVKVPLEDPWDKEFCTIKAKGRKLFLKVCRFVMGFEEFKTITNF